MIDQNELFCHVFLFIKQAFLPLLRPRKHVPVNIICNISAKHLIQGVQRVSNGSNNCTRG